MFWQSIPYNNTNMREKINGKWIHAVFQQYNAPLLSNGLDMGNIKKIHYQSFWSSFTEDNYFLYIFRT